MKGDVYGNQKNKKPLIIGLICGGVILLAVIVIMIVMFLKNNDSKDTSESKKWETIKVTNEVTTEITTEATTEATSEITTEATTEATTETTTEATTEDHAEEEYNEACVLFDEGKYYSAKKAFEHSRYDDWEQRAEACVQPAPETGEIWHDENMYSKNMCLIFTVADEEDDVCQYIAVYTRDRELVESLFIRGTDSVETWIPPGEYYVRNAKGTVWYGEQELFGDEGTYEKMIFDAVEDDRYLTVLEPDYQYEITINASQNVGQGVESEETDWDSWD
jgi:hypothetical protein